MNVRKQPQNFFFYGSLLTGTLNRRINKRMRRLLHRARPAVIQARLYNLGQYPGVVTSNIKTDRVYGKVITIGEPRLLKDLDRYEDCFGVEPIKSEFIRITMPVRLLPTGRRIDCWIYVYNHNVKGKQRIASGDYVLYKKSRGKWLARAAASK